MHVYCFKDPETGTVYDAMYPRGEAPASIVVEGQRCPRDMPSEWQSQNIAGDWAHPIVSQALGWHPSQMAELRAAAARDKVPLECVSDGRVVRPVFRNRSQRRQVCEWRNVIDQDAGFSDAMPRQRGQHF